MSLPAQTRRSLRQPAPLWTSRRLSSPIKMSLALRVVSGYTQAMLCFLYWPCSGHHFPLSLPSSLALERNLLPPSPTQFASPHHSGCHPYSTSSHAGGINPGGGGGILTRLITQPYALSSYLCSVMKTHFLRHGPLMVLLPRAGWNFAPENRQFLHAWQTYYTSWLSWTHPFHNNSIIPWLGRFYMVEMSETGL